MSGIDEQQLSDLIEGELSAADAEKLRAQLIAKDPTMAARVVAMQHDRQMLRSLPPVDPPMDFLAELEPMIARPMLMDGPAGAEAMAMVTTKPGAARRAVHRQQRRAQLVPAAMAAGIVIILSGGLWYTLSQIGVFNGEQRVAINNNSSESTEHRTVAINGAATNSVESAVVNETNAARLLASGLLHHKLPPFDQQPIAGASSTFVAEAEIEDEAEFQLTDSPRFVLADFELTIQTRHDDDPQNVLARAIEPLAGRAAVVRNLTADSLKRIEAAWLAGRSGAAGSGEPARAGVNNTNAADNGNLPRGRRAGIALNADMLRDSADKLIESGLVAGEPALMPQYSMQIELSEAGSIYTLVLPVRDVQLMLERLSSVRGVDSAMLTMRSDANAEATAGASGAARWLRDLTGVQQAWQRLASEQPDTVVVLPVVIGSK